MENFKQCAETQDFMDLHEEQICEIVSAGFMDAFKSKIKK